MKQVYRRVPGPGVRRKRAWKRRMRETRGRRERKRESERVYDANYRRRRAGLAYLYIGGTERRARSRSPRAAPRTSRHGKSMSIDLP